MQFKYYTPILFLAFFQFNHINAVSFNQKHGFRSVRDGKKYSKKQRPYPALYLKKKQDDQKLHAASPLLKKYLECGIFIKEASSINVLPFVK